MPSREAPVVVSDAVRSAPAVVVKDARLNVVGTHLAKKDRTVAPRAFVAEWPKLRAAVEAGQLLVAVRDQPLSVAEIDAAVVVWAQEPAPALQPPASPPPAAEAPAPEVVALRARAEEIKRLASAANAEAAKLRAELEAERADGQRDIAANFPRATATSGPLELVAAALLDEKRTLAERALTLRLTRERPQPRFTAPGALAELAARAEQLVHDFEDVLAQVGARRAQWGEESVTYDKALRAFQKREAKRRAEETPEPRQDPEARKAALLRECASLGLKIEGI